MKIIGSIYEHDAIFRNLDLYIHNIGELERVLQMYPEEHKVVCWMMVNNITGTCFPIEEIGKLCHKYNAFYVMDITAALGHYPISSNLESFCDCIFASGHKIHAEKGIGFMWLSDRFASFLKLPNDPHDEYGMIKGTPNVPGAIALSYAVEKAVDNVDKKNELWRKLAHHLVTELDDNGVEAYLWGDDEDKTYAINSIYLPGMNGDGLVQFLSSRGVYVSPCHSACSNQSDYRVAKALGMTEEEASHSIRVSFGTETALEDVNKLIEGIIKFKELFI